MPNFPRRWLGLAKTLLLTTLVLAAAASVALRLSLPRLIADVPALEARVGSRLGLPVRVASLQLHWQRGLPVVSGEDVQILRAPDDAIPVLHFKHVHASLDPLASILSGKPQFSRLQLSGLGLRLVLTRTGKIVVDGFPVQDPRVLRWLLQQHGLSLKDTRLSLRDEAGRFPDLDAEGLDAVLALKGGDVQLEGHLTRLGKLARELRISVTLSGGDVTDPASRIRVMARTLDLSALAGFAGVTVPNDIALTGDAWLEAGRTPTGVPRFSIRLNDITGTTSRAGDPTDASAPWGVEAVMSLSPERLQAQVTRLVTPGMPDGYTIDWRIEGKRSPNGSGLARMSASADRIPLELLAWMPADAPTSPLTASGELRNFSAGWKAGAPTRHFARATLIDASVAARDPHPGVTGLNASVELRDSQLRAAFADAHFTLTHSRLVAPLEIAGLTGVMDVRREGIHGLHLASEMQGLFNGLLLHAAGTLTQPEEGPLQLDTRFDFGTGDLSRLHTLIPDGVLKPGGERWLRQAFPAGILRGARIVARGPGNRFPWDDDAHGKLWAQFAVEDTTLRYSREWPSAKAVRGEVAIAGRTLSGVLSEARFGDSPLVTARLDLPDLFSPAPEMTVQGNINARLPDVVATLRESPLAERSVPALSPLTLEGEVDLALDLRLGLKKGMRREVRGRIGFAENTLQTAPGGLRLTGLNGQLAFAPEGWTGDGLTAQLGTRTVGIDVGNGRDANDRPAPTFAFTGQASDTEVFAELERRAPLVAKLLRAETGGAPSFHGTLAWRAKVVGPPEARRLELTSDLVGMRLDLPPPLAKPMETPLALGLDLPYGTPAVTADALSKVQLGEVLRATVRTIATPKGRQMAQLDLAFGSETASDLEVPGIFLHGRLQELALGPWLARLRQSAGSSSGLPTRLDLHATRLQTLGQTFPEVILRGQRGENTWDLRIDGPRVAGLVIAPHGRAGGPLVLNLERLWLERAGPVGAASAAPAPASERSAGTDPRSLPPLVMACASFRYGALELGQASLATASIPEGLRLEALVFQTQAAQIKAHGRWTRSATGEASQFSIKVKADELAPMLKDFGYDGRAISGGRTVLDIEAGWPGTPGDFTLEKLDGSLSLKVRKGQLLDIEPGSVRLFGLLSVQTLPRRLSFDFADLYRKGYAFDRIEGWFKLEGGNAYTNTLFMEGPSSRVEVRGRAGLAARDYDQRATVTPALSKSIPLASAVFGPAGIGAGAAIYLGQQVFDEVPAQMDKFLRQEYRITGTWDKPKVEKQ